MPTSQPAPPTPKQPRNNRRHQKRNTTPSTQKVALLTTPPSSPPRNPSPGGTATDSSNTANTAKKKGPRSNKKPRDAPKPSPAQRNGHRHTSSNPNNAAIPQMNSPHYAGPTFHASPAPSALPIPSFFSKSMPDSDIAPVLESESDNFDGDADLETTPSKPRQRPQYESEEPEPTPLDFLFKAAVEARNSQPQRSPEPHPRTRSPQTDSKTLPQRKNLGPSNGMFPFEMEAPDARSAQIGPSFAPSYKDRMNALRSSNSPSPQAAELDDNQRRVKTEALKSLLLNPRPQRPSSASTSNEPQTFTYDNRSSGSPSVPHFATPLRAPSGPPPPTSHRAPFEHQKAPSPYNSPLRKDVLSSIYPNPLPSNQQRHDQAKYANNGAYQPMRSPARHPSPPTRNVTGSPSAQGVDTKKMEDDLRRILKLDVNPGFPSSSIQSSYA
ncbi:hypothetical protein BDV59DRAFT_184451 [Aspergillus ambiguus]|uniref:uncharacterized protein n=1 Tax=Aspergillus ambiguus TaxID=176160 RepID=UPI003CCE53FC